MMKALEYALKLGANEAEIVRVIDRSVSIPFKADELGPIKLARKEYYGIRLVYDKRVAYTYYSGSREGLEKAVERTLAVAKASNKLEDRPGLPNVEGMANVKNIYHDDIIAVAAGDLSKPIEIIKRIRDLANELGVTLSRNSLDVHFYNVELANSHGIVKGYKSTIAYVTLQVLYNKGASREFEVSRSLDIDVDDLVNRGARKAKDADKAELIGTFSGEAIFEPAASGELIEVMFGSAIRGDQVIKGGSPLKDKVGQQIAAKEFSLYDDGTLEAGIRSSPFDDEGVPSQKTEIVIGGELKGFIYDRYRGHKAGKTSTGNAFVTREGYPPSVSPSNLVLKPHKGTLEDLISSVDKGLVVTDTIGARLSDPVGGIYNATVTLGYLVKGGEIEKPVKGVVVNIPFWEAIKEIRIGSEPIRPHMFAYAPPVVLPKATFAAKK